MTDSASQATTITGRTPPAFKPKFDPGPTPDFSSPDTFLAGHPYAEYERLRRQAPIFWNPEPAPGPGFWVLTRYRDIEYVSMHPELFCNRYGYKSVDNTYGRISDHVGAAMSRILPAIDPPEHTVFKKVLAPFFSGRAVKALEDNVREKARRIIGRLENRSRIDTIKDLAIRLPIEVLADLMGMPEADQSKLVHWTNAIFGADDPDYFARPQDALPGFIEMFEYGKAAMDDRRAHPRDDLLSLVANTKVDGEYLDREQIDGTLAMLVGAGNETTRNAISSSLLVLWQSPEVRRRLVDEPDLIEPASHELLRYVAPNIHMRRTAVEDTEIDGQRIGSGEKVVMLYGAANRDPEVFPDPDRLEIERPNAKRHLSFGVGVHRCIGAILAQTQLRIFLEEFLPRYPDYRVVSGPVYLRHNFVNAIKSMGLRLT